MAQGPVVHSALRVVPGALLLGAAWVLCAPPSRALGTVATAGKALNHGTDDHQPVLLSSRALAQSPWEVMAQGPVVHSALRVVPGALLLSAAWVLCVPPSRALVTATTAGKALNHGTDDHRPIFALFASADIPKPTSRHPKCWCCLFSYLFCIVLSYLPSS